MVYILVRTQIALCEVLWLIRRCLCVSCRDRGMQSARRRRKHVLQINGAILFHCICFRNDGF